ncbi:helix-turn-helix domain-containing protein [bacterium]|nr:helix-turn-helix domain-containing protein [bacterium]
MSDTTQGSRTLKAWLDDGRTNRRTFADLCGVSRQAVHRWESGEARPSAKQQHRIAHLTSDAVRVVDWLTAAERVEVTR